MKITGLLFAILLGISFQTQAQQISKNAIGLRLGDNDGFGTEINYQRGLTDNNRLEFGLQYAGNSGIDLIKTTGLYQWIWPIEGRFNWYAGAGGGLAIVSFDDNIVFDGDDDNEVFLFAAGNVGIEYNFDFPLLLSLDVRPELGFGNFRNDLDLDIALGVRYQFD